MSTVHIAAMSELLEKFDASLKVRHEQTQGRVRRLLEELPQLRLDAAKSRLPEFNVLERCGLYADERQHSTILAWLLEAGGSHAQGNAFFVHFAQLCELKLTPQVMDYSVRTEFPGFESIADIVVFRKGDFLIYIENKIFAAEGSKQLDRQERDLGRQAEVLQIPQDRIRAVFLTPNGRRPVTSSSRTWQSVSYPQITQALKPLLARRPDAKLVSFVGDWLSVLTDLNEVAYVE